MGEVVLGAWRPGLAAVGAGLGTGLEGEDDFAEEGAFDHGGYAVPGFG